MIRCSLCHKPNTEVEHMLAGRHGNICSECVDVAATTMAEIRTDRAAAMRRSLAETTARKRVEWTEKRGTIEFVEYRPHGE